MMVSDGRAGRSVVRALTGGGERLVVQEAADHVSEYVRRLANQGRAE